MAAEAGRGKAKYGDTNMQMKKTLIMTTVIFNCGCVPNLNVASYEDELSNWVGKSEYTLYSEWGYPNATYSVDYNTFIVTYIKSYKEPIGGDKEPYAAEMY